MARLEHDYAAEIRRTLVDPAWLCDRLGLGKDAQRQASGVLVRCPEHDERTPSCSVTRGPDGTIRVRCFGCGWTGDALTLVGSVHGLSTRTSFRDVLLEAASLAGLHAAVDELSGQKPYQPRQVAPQSRFEPNRDFPPVREVNALWEASRPASDDEDSAWHLEGRGINPRDASRRGLVRALTDSDMPSWARYRGAPWPECGFRLVVPAFDASGTMRSVRAWRVTAGEGPKRLPPAGHRASGLVLANEPARRVLAGESPVPVRMVLVEGEPDFVSVSVHWPSYAVIGVFSGSWSQDFAARIPLGSEIVIRTHHDEAGDRYAAEVVKSARDRAVIRRSAA